MSTYKSAEPQLWKVARQHPYVEHKFSTIVRDFTPSFIKRQQPFIMEDKIISKEQPFVLDTTFGAPTKNRT